MNVKNILSIIFFVFLITPVAYAASTTTPQPLTQDLIGPAAQNVVDFNEPVDEEVDQVDKKGKWNDIITIAAAVEIELHRVKDFNQKWFTSFQVATAEIDFSLYINDWVSALVAIESDIDAGDIMDLKEGYFTIGGTDEYPYFLKAGYQYVPFGLGDGAILGDTLTISNPLTIDIFETRQSAAMFGKLWEDYRVGAYVLDRSRLGTVHHHTQFGLTFDKGKEEDDYTYDFGIDFLSSAFETDGMTDAFPQGLAINFAPEISLHGRYYKNHISFISELETGLSKYSFTQDGTDYHINPAAWMVELGYVTEIYSLKSYAAIDYSESYNMQGFFAKNRLLGVVGVWFLDNTLLAFEVGHENDYSVSNGGTGNSAMTYIMQLAIEL